MDASASPKPDVDNVYSFYMKFDSNNYPQVFQNKSTIIKYTKLPDFDFDAKTSWPTPQSYTLQPRLRRVVALDNNDLKTTRSLRSNFTAPTKDMATTYTKRKIVTISEDDGHGQQPGYYSVKKKNTSPVRTSNRTSGVDFKLEKQPPHRNNSRMTSTTKFSVRKKSPSPVKSTNRSVETDFKTEKQPSSRITSRLTTTTKYTKETKTSAKTNSAYNKKEVNLTQQNYYRGRRGSSPPTENLKMKHGNERVSHSPKSAPPSKTTNVSKNFIISSESEKEFARIKNIFYDNLKTDFNCKQKSPEKASLSRPPLTHNKNKINMKDLKKKPVTLIRVPREDTHQLSQVTEVKSDDTMNTHTETVRKVNRANYTDDILILKHVNIGTDPPNSVDQVTEMDDFNVNTICKCESSVQTESMKEIFDSLEIPNVTLTKEKSEPKETVKMNSTSLPNLKVPPFNVSPVKEDVSSSDLSFCQGASFIISRATLTYTTRQKINFHIVGNDEDVSSNMPPSPLDYPIKVMSVFKNELHNKQENVSSDDTCKKKNDTRDAHINTINELNSPNCSYVFNKLMKPSDIISTIRVNDDLLQNDYICEQFQRELNFIDSFFESLQYLESCSLSEKCFPDSKVDSLVNNSALFDSTFAIRNTEYDNFLSKLENGAHLDDTETIASQSLCLLNLLIRDEQRRAKNLLFVLKMREDALKDFTKSQILWLEKKKKHDNTDISTLKKKQRGALLKLQHECGEMQRMRKALLTLSEKRKVALMKTKKNIELKLKNNVHVEQIILGKKKLKRISPGDRNASPLKCFDLSSSGCEESTTSRPISEAAVVPAPLTKVTSAEKCVQTGETPSTTPKDDVSDTSPENLIAVDGGYLNILFHDLALPQIFSSGKQYEVNEEELKNIVSSSSNHCNNLSGSEIVEKLMDTKNKEVEVSSPSTARSLVDEYDQYYRGLLEDDKSRPDSPVRQRECSSDKKVFEIKDSCVQIQASPEPPVELAVQDASVVTSCEDSVLINDTNSSDNGLESCVCDPVGLEENQCVQEKSLVSHASQTTGPLPVPVGAAAVVDSTPPDSTTWTPAKSTTSFSSDIESVSSQPQNATSSTLTALTTPAQCEAEELRRQQLAIEREIKALEQQQCRLLVVREIPDKPPPPYTPPAETKPKPPRMFALDDAAEKKIEKFYTSPKNTICEEEDAFDSFLKDFCHESIERNKQDQTDKPWDACNLLPQKPPVDTQKQIKNTCVEIKEVLSSITPTLVSGVSSRRSDHIDDILFTEWRRCEPDWTTLNTDEVFVKNQLFESIFQKILTETIDEYKKSVTTD